MSTNMRGKARALRTTGFWIMIGWVTVALALIGCEGSAQAATNDDPPGAMLGARQMPAAYGGVVEINSEVRGDIFVVAYPATEVGLDYTVTGHTAGPGATEDTAIEEALDNFTVDLVPIAGGVRIQARRTGTGNSAAGAQDSVELHVRVPVYSHIIVDSPAGSITVSGGVDSANVHTGQGDIVVHSALGRLQLRTDRGSIRADERAESPVRHDLRANQGSITFFALQSNVNAVTTGADVRFIGTLVGDNNVFETNGAGNIEISLPDNMTYGFRMQGGSQVINDFLRGMRVCGIVDGSLPFDYHSWQTRDRDFGRVAVGDTTPVSPTTASVSGVMAAGYDLFHTNRGAVRVSLPPAQGTEPTITHTTTDCRDLDPNPRLDVKFEARAEQGRIVVQRIRMNKP